VKTLGGCLTHLSHPYVFALPNGVFDPNVSKA
jgi:hypothetical protein